MSAPSDSQTRTRPSASIIAVAAFQIVVGLLTLIPFERGMHIAYFSDQYSVSFAENLSLAILGLTVLFGIVTGLGLLKRCAWARGLTLFLATVPVCAAAIGVLTYKRQPGFDFTPLILDALLVVLVPVSFWWWILFTRPSIRAQFH